MNLIGLPLIKKVHLNKYNILIMDDAFFKNINRLTNQIWKLIPMYENKEDWEKQLSTVLIEIIGLNELLQDYSFIQLISKLEGLLLMDISFDLFRKTVFECISLLQESVKYGK